MRSAVHPSTKLWSLLTFIAFSKPTLTPHWAQKLVSSKPFHSLSLLISFSGRLRDRACGALSESAAKQLLSSQLPMTRALHVHACKHKFVTSLSLSVSPTLILELSFLATSTDRSPLPSFSLSPSLFPSNKQPNFASLIKYLWRPKLVPSIAAFLHWKRFSRAHAHLRRFSVGVPV